MNLYPESAELLGPVFEAGAGDGAVALQAPDRSVSYAELRRDVEGYAEALRRAGVEPGDRVALVLPKSVGTVELILAVLAIGAAYVPLNPTQPPVRLRAMLDDLEPTLVIASPETAALVRADRAFATAILGPHGLAMGPGALLQERHRRERGLASILYTSGSTGEPKGIMLSHRNIASFVDWAAYTFNIGGSDRLANVAPFHFDLSIFDLFCGLTRRASVHLLGDEAARFPGQVRHWLDANAITVWYSVPTALARLQQRRALQGVASLRLVLFAGEVFPIPVLRQVMADLPGPEYVNLYGPTETNVCTYHRLPGPPASDTDALPIGQTCEHLTVTIRDPALREVAPGEVGEICVEGPAVMRGYSRRPKATQTSQIPGHPDSYRTGDYGWRRADGEIMFAGRRDHQLKVRGHRVELLALEAVLNGHPAVGEAAALGLPEPGGHRLAAALVPRRTAVPDAEIRRFIAERLPSYYQPDRVDWLPELPRTATGKCDRAGLLTSLHSLTSG